MEAFLSEVSYDSKMLNVIRVEKGLASSVLITLSTIHGQWECQESWPHPIQPCGSWGLTLL